MGRVASLAKGKPVSNTRSLTRSRSRWLAPAGWKRPGNRRTEPRTWPSKGGNSKQRRATGPHERCGKPSMGMWSREKQRDGSARIVKGPRRSIRRWPRSGVFRRLLPIAEVADDLERRFPEDTFAKFTYVPVLRAASALERGKPGATLRSAADRSTLRTAVNGLNFNWILGGLHSAYVRGQALMAARRYLEATAEFSEDSRSSWARERGSHRRARARAVGKSLRPSGRHDQSKGCLPEFSHPLERHDPDIPILKQAKAELARLQ